MTRRTRGLLVLAALAGSLAIQLRIARIPDTMGDAILYGDWLRRIEHVGLDRVYLEVGPDHLNYPPVFPWILKVLAALRPSSPVISATARLHEADLLVKLPAILAGMLTSLLIFTRVRKTSSFLTAYAVMVSYAFNPAVIFDSAYWGQIDAVSALFVLLALACLAERNVLAWVFVTLAVLTKPHAAPFAPIVLLVTLRDRGWMAVVRGGLAGLATVGVVFSPFIAAGHTGSIAWRMLMNLTSSPYASSNAHNLWFLVTSGRWLECPNCRVVGSVLFGTVYAFVLARLWRRQCAGDLYALCAAVAASFFILMTGMHENHLFAVIPLLAIACHRDRRLAVLYGLFSLTFLANMALHDPYLETTYIYGRKFDPWQIWAFDPSGPKSHVQLVLTLVNSLANVVLAGTLLALTIPRSDAARDR